MNAASDQRPRRASICRPSASVTVNVFESSTDGANPLALDLDALYERYLVTCRMSGVEPVPRERAFGLIQEWSEVLSGRPEATEH